ncbi:TPA: hypothetical protein ACH3X1_013314 [Trebouxia sp. C0004]
MRQWLHRLHTRVFQLDLKSPAACDDNFLRIHIAAKEFEAASEAAIAPFQDSNGTVTVILTMFLCGMGAALSSVECFSPKPVVHCIDELQSNTEQVGTHFTKSSGAQVCSDATPKHCSTGQGRIASPVFSVALQNRLTACLCHCKYIYGDLVVIQVCSDATPKHCSTGQGRIASPPFRVALQNRLTACL